MPCVTGLVSPDHPCPSSSNLIFKQFPDHQREPHDQYRTHLWSFVHPSRVPRASRVPSHPSAPTNTHHGQYGHPWPSMSHLPILLCFGMCYIVLLRACLKCWFEFFFVFPLSIGPNPNPEHLCLCCYPFPDSFIVLLGSALCILNKNRYFLIFILIVNNQY